MDAMTPLGPFQHQYPITLWSQRIICLQPNIFTACFLSLPLSPPHPIFFPKRLRLWSRIITRDDAMCLFWPPLGSVSVIKGCAKSDLPTGLVPGSGPTPPGVWLTSELRSSWNHGLWLGIQGLKGCGLSASTFLFICMWHIQIPLCLYIFLLLYMSVCLSGHGKNLNCLIAFQLNTINIYFLQTVLGYSDKVCSQI